MSDTLHMSSSIFVNYLLNGVFSAAAEISFVFQFRPPTLIMIGAFPHIPPLRPFPLSIIFAKCSEHVAICMQLGRSAQVSEQ